MLHISKTIGFIFILAMVWSCRNSSSHTTPIIISYHGDVYVEALLKKMTLEENPNSRLTPKEFSEAKRLGALYWLYVVERALERAPIAKIHFIQDPAGKVDEFRYDSGWQQAAETDTRKLLPEEEW